MRTMTRALFAALADAVLAAGAAAQQSPGDDLVFRRIWSSTAESPRLSLGPPAGGRYLSAIGPRENVLLHDLATGESRRLTENNNYTDGFALSAVISPDGAYVAYHWFVGNSPDGEVTELRVIETDGTNQRTLLANRGGQGVRPVAWADERTILARRGAGSGELISVSAVDGAVRVLHRFESGQVGDVSASPDGRWIAYTFRPDDGGDTDIYALPVTGGTPTALILGNGSDRLMGWTPDGSGILFYSDRELTRAIWKLTVRGGRPVGEPELVRADVWDLQPVGFSGDQYFYRVTRESPQIRTATIDAQAGRVVNPPAPVRPASEGWSREPAWSPDGRYLAFVDYPTGFDDGTRLGIQSVHTGETRYQSFPFEAFAQPWWAPDARTLTVFGRHQGRPGIYRLDLQSGEVIRLLDRTDGEDGITSAPDGSRYYYHRQRRDLYARDLTTGEETHLARLDGLWRRVGVSPDGELLAVRVGGCMEESRLLVLPAAGGEPREIYRGMHLGCSDFLDITPDHQFVIAATFGPDGGVWRFSMDGSEPVKLLDADPRGFRLSPDGRRIAYWEPPSPVGSQELWVIEGLASAPREPEAAPEARAAAGDMMIGDFEAPELDADVGQWMGWSDRSCCAGTSTAAIEVVPGGVGGTATALAVRGATEQNEIWVGAGALFWFTSPADLSRWTDFTFWARGTGDTYRFFMFGPNAARDIASTEFIAGPEWQEVTIPLSELSAVDPGVVSGILVGRGEPAGEYSLRIDRVRMR